MRHGDAQRARIWRVAWQDLNRRKDAYREEAIRCWITILMQQGKTEAEARVIAANYLHQVDLGVDAALKESEESLAQATTGPTEAMLRENGNLRRLYSQLRELIDPGRKLDHDATLDRVRSWKKAMSIVPGT